MVGMFWVRLTAGLGRSEFDQRVLLFMLKLNKVSACKKTLTCSQHVPVSPLDTISIRFTLEENPNVVDKSPIQQHPF